MLDLSRYPQLITTYLITYGTRLLAAIIIFLIGLWVIKRLVKIVNNVMTSYHVDPTLRPFMSNILNVTLRVLLLILVIGQLGVEMTSIFAVLASAGLAVGLALQGSLSNFAGGVLILAIKPFRVGDYIEAQGVGGRVHIINILNTVIKTADNKTIYIPNGPLANSTITNHDVEPNRRTEVRLVVQHGNDIEQAKSLVQDIIKTDDRILQEPAPQVVTENTDAGIAVIGRAWTIRENIGGLTNDLHDRIRAAFDRENITLNGPRKAV
ncbi:transporter [Adhaeribacter aerolatus]|uniref:Transporter n=1 Tax=Adhaeribacter aerolatus TaxID=670289 RepID=A0A512AU79_9BACT|nr:mechanosensitive ion channel domain-containing protein [Adhaeribacter aerolatus]GEO03266.1 transporter [Adhaeribacter aerolatus]